MDQGYGREWEVTHKRLSTEELVIECEWMLSANTSASLLCTWLEMKPDAIAHRLRRAGRSDLAAPFWDEVALRRAGSVR